MARNPADPDGMPLTSTGSPEAVFIFAMTSILPRCLTLIAALLLIAAPTGCSDQSRLSRHLENAARYLDAGELERAEIEYLNVLKLEPQNATAITQLGIVYFDQGRLTRAVPYLLGARELKSDNLAARLRLAKVYQSGGKFDEARTEALFILERDPGNGEALVLLAEAAHTPDELAAVRNRLETLAPDVHESAPFNVARGILAFREGRIDEAARLLQQAQAADPESALVHAALAQLYSQKGDGKAARAAIQRAAELAPARSPYRIQYARQLVRDGDLATARGVLEETTREAADYQPAWLGLADLAFARKDFDEGMKLVNRVLAIDPAQSDALLLRARFNLAQGNADAALGELERLAESLPSSPQIHHQLALAHLARNEIDEAIGSLQRAVELAPGFAEATVTLASLQLRTGDAAAAVATLEPLAQAQPELVEGQLVLAAAYRAQNRLNDTLAIYRRLQKLQPHNPQFALFEGLVLAQQRKPEDARAALQRALEADARFLPALEQLVNLDISERNFAAALQRVETQLAEQPDVAGLHLLRAKVLLAGERYAEAEPALEKAIQLEPEASQPYMLLAQLYLQSQRFDAALTRLDELSRQDPNNVGALMLAGIIHEQQGDHQAARTSYERLLKVSPDFAPALNNLAYLCAEHFDEVDRGYELARRARELRPRDPLMADTLGWILYRRGEYNWALSLLQESAERLPDTAEVQYHLGMVHYAMGNEADARAAFVRAQADEGTAAWADEVRQCLAILDINPRTADAAARATLERRLAETEDPVALERLAAVHQREGELTKAAGAYERALKVNPRQAVIRARLASVYAAQGQDEKAFALAQEARQQDAKNPEIAHVLGRLAFARGDFAWAHSLLRTARTQQPDAPELLFDAARAAYAVGRSPEAEEVLSAALSGKADFTRREEAQRFLELMRAADEPGQSADMVGVARETLRTEPDHGPAHMVVGRAAEHAGDLAGARRAYEQMLAARPNFIPAQLRLALLAACHDDDLDKAYALANKVREAVPGDARAAAPLGIVAARQGEHDRAIRLLNDALRAGKDDSVLRFYLGMAQLNQGDQAAGRSSLERALALGLTPELQAEAQRLLAEPEQAP